MGFINRFLGAALFVAAAMVGTCEAKAQETERFATPSGKTLSVTTGESVFVEGNYALRDTFVLTAEINSTMPGSMMIPFSFRIEPGDLVFRGASREWEYFCAPNDRSAASFPGLGSVVSNGDCVGLRRRLSDNRLEWTVDNSIHNGMTTIWSRRVRDNEMALLREEERQVITDVAVRRAVYFDGFYSGLLNFTFVDGGQRREMKFDYGGEGEKLIGMVGKRMLVLGADSVELRYRWVE